MNTINYLHGQLCDVANSLIRYLSVPVMLALSVYNLMIFTDFYFIYSSFELTTAWSSHGVLALVNTSSWIIRHIVDVYFICSFSERIKQEVDLSVSLILANIISLNMFNLLNTQVHFQADKTRDLIHVMKTDDAMETNERVCFLNRAKLSFGLLMRMQNFGTFR